MLEATAIRAIEVAIGGGAAISSTNPLPVFDINNIDLAGIVTGVPGANQFTIDSLKGLGDSLFCQGEPGASEPYVAFVLKVAGRVRLTGVMSGPFNAGEAVAGTGGATGDGADTAGTVQPVVVRQISPSRSSCSRTRPSCWLLTRSCLRNARRGTGAALAARASARSYRVYVLMGDGETQDPEVKETHS